MRPVRTLAALAAATTVLAGCGAAAADPGQTLRDALEGFEPPAVGTTSVRVAGDVAGLAAALGDEAGDALGDLDPTLLTESEFRVTSDGERAGVAADVGGVTALDLRVVSDDEVYVRLDLAAVEQLAAAAGEDVDAGADLDELTGLFADGPLAAVFTGEWVRIIGLAEAGGGLGLDLPESDDLPGASDVDVEAALSALETVDVVEAGEDGRCGSAVRYDAVVPGAVLEELLASAGELAELGSGAGDLGLGAGALGGLDGDGVPGSVDLAVWLDDDDVSCVGVDLGASFARSGADVGVADVAGLVHVVVRFTDDLAGLAAPTDATDLDLGEVFAGFLGAALGELSGDAPLPGTDPASGAQDYGDDPRLDALWDACEAGDGQACDDLYFGSPFGSAYEQYGDTCGGREEPGAVLCAEVYGSD